MRTPKQKKITLCWYCLTPQGWRYFPSVLEHKQNVWQAKHGWVTHNGSLQQYPNGRYVLRSYEAGRKVYKPIETLNPVLAVVAAHGAQRQAIRTASVQRQDIIEGRAHKHSSLKSAADAYLHDTEKVRKVMGAHREAKLVLGEFLPVAAKLGVFHVKAVTQKTILAYQNSLRKHGTAKHQHRSARANGNGAGNSERTVRNKTRRLLSFLKFCGVDVKSKAVFSSEYMPRVHKRIPKTYNHEQVEQLLSAVSDRRSGQGCRFNAPLRIAVLLGLKVGLREREIMHATFSNIDWKDATYTVKEKPEFGFTVKNFKERTVPVPPELMTELKAWRETHPKVKLIAGTKTDKPNLHLLRALKAAVRCAGLNCDECKGCHGTERECYQWDLHTLRRTWVTTMLQSGGFDVNTVRDWAGHADLATTMLYLRPAAEKDVKAKLKNVTWGSV